MVGASHPDSFSTDRLLQIRVEPELPPKPRREPDRAHDAQRVVLERLEGRHGSSDARYEALYEAEVLQAAPGLVLDLPRLEVVEERVDGQVAALSVFERGSEGLEIVAIS